ncbi:MAG TPA: hypothetical protein VN894_16940, partial [Polyangiaceae bacterium]|nr:hypothetical protein [Polyangiaceae bacterium]
MDGQLLSDRLDGTAISLDPGEHRFVFEAPGRPEVERVIVLHEAEKERRERVVFESLPAPSAPPPAAGDALRTVSIVAGAAGGVGLALGSVFGLMASSSWSSSKAECASPVNCQNHGAAVSDHDTALTDATISTIAFAAGGAALAAGVVLFVTSVTRPQATGVRWQLVPAVGSGGGGIVWKMSL